MADKPDIARALEEIAILLDLSGESRFKVRAYERGARVVAGLPADLGPLIESDQLTQFEGIGGALAQQISELWKTGTSSLLERLRSTVPPGAAELATIPGLTPRRIRALHAALAIDSVEALRNACTAHRVQKVQGFGAKTEQRLLEAIELRTKNEHRVILKDALELIERMEAQLTRAGITMKVAGAVRRAEETISEMEILIVAETEELALNELSRLPAVLSVDRARRVARLANGLPLRIHFAKPESLGVSWIVATGPTPHVQCLERLAEIRGLEFSTNGLLEPGTVALGAQAEEDVYRQLRVEYVPPELRASVSSERAIEEADFSELITFNDVRGLVHCHTTYSDGRDSIEDMARAAEALGMSYITITDHSPSAYYARGVNLDALKEQWDEIARVQESVKIRILRGTESDILGDGALDYPDAILENLDVVIASIHSRLKMNRQQMTERLQRALSLPVFKIWGHALGRILLNRAPIDCDVPAVLDAIAQSPAAIEINGDPHRLDLPPEWVPLAKQRGIPFVLSVDAHSTNGFGALKYAVAMARRGALRRADVLNTLSAEEFAARVRPVTPT